MADDPISNATFLYFAYGSNMSARRLQARAPSAELIGRAEVMGFRLTFDKFSRRDGSGKADCEKTRDPTDQVLGGLYRVNAADRDALDAAEGAGFGYEATDIVVQSRDGPRRALTYLATDKRPGLTPYTWYLRHVVEGARELGLPMDYVTQIERVPALSDPNPEREAREFAIYGTPI